MRSNPFGLSLFQIERQGVLVWSECVLTHNWAKRGFGFEGVLVSGLMDVFAAFMWVQSVFMVLVVTPCRLEAMRRRAILFRETGAWLVVALYSRMIA